MQSFNSFTCFQKNNPKEVKKGKKGAKIKLDWKRKLEKNAVSADYDIFLKDSHGGGGAVDDDGDEDYEDYSY